MTAVTIDYALRIAVEHHNGRRLAEAEAIYRQVLRVQPQNLSALYLLGQLCLATGRREPAVDLLRQATTLKPDLTEGLLALGRTLKELGRESEAVAAYSQVLVQDPHNLQAVVPLLAHLLEQAARSFDTPHGPIRFLCMDELPLMRASTLLSKEPETLEWIDAFDADDVFWDVGANVGVYTLYAANAARAGRILAFEPAAGNYMLLNRNIELNGMDGVVSAYCLAFGDGDAIDALHMQTTELGGAMSSFATPIDQDGKPFTAKFRQGTLGFSIDGFIERFAPPFPNRLKIDVDGLEDRIVAGAAMTLADPRLKSLSIELDDRRPDLTGPVVAAIEAAGLRFASKRHAAMFDGGPYANIYNFQFFRP